MAFLGITRRNRNHVGYGIRGPGNKEAAKRLGEAIEKEVLKAENSITVSLPKEEELPVVVAEALDNAA